MEFVPLAEVRGQQAGLVKEWQQVESYQKTLATHTPRQHRDEGGWALIRDEGGVL